MPEFLGEDNANEIIPGLWIGNYKASNRLSFLEKNNIKYIIRTDFKYTLKWNKKRYLNIKISSKKNCKSDKISTFEKTNEFIYEGLMSGNVLVQCKRGHHRSSTLVTAFIIKYMKKSYVEARKLVKSKRPYSFYRKTCLDDALKRYHEINKL
jgi:protein-tyrosine phosphatase